MPPLRRRYVWKKSYLFENLPGSRYWNRTLTITYLTPGVETGNRLKIVRICIDNRKKERFLIIRKMYKKGIEEKLIREVTGCTKKEFAAAVGK